MLVLPKSCADEIIAHANEEYPNECCGMAIGPDESHIKQIVRGRNEQKSPYGYTINGEDMLKALTLSRERGWEMVGFYHSHTAIDATKVTEAYPSETDIRESAAWPEAAYLIVSLKDRARPEIRAFRINDGEVSEEDLQVV